MLCFYFRAKNKLHIIFFLLILVNVLLTRSKASYIGFAGGVCAFTALAAFFISAATGKQKKTFLIVFTTLIVLLTSLSVGYLVRQRIDSVRFRVFTWMSTVSLIHDRPIFGNGIGVFKITYPRVRREEIFHIEGKHNTETDHPENEYLEVLHDEGIVGAGIFLWCLATVFSAGIRWLARDMGKEKLNEEGSVKKKTVRIIPRHTYIAGLMASLFGLLVHNLMCVNMRFVSSGFPFWVLMGLTCAQISPAVIKDGRGKVKSSVKYAANLLQIGIIVLSVYLGIFFYRFMEADMYHNIAIAYSKAGQWDEALRYYHRVLKNNPYYTMTHYFMGNVYNDRWDMQKRYKPEWDDKDFKPRDDSERALAKYDDLKKLAPNYVQVHFQVGTVYERLGQWDNALENFKKALALDPVFAPTYFKMGWCYVQKEDWANAEAVYRKAVEWNPGFVQAYVNLGNVYYMQKKLDLALKSYQEALKIEPGNKHLQEVVAQILKFKDRLQ